MTTRHVVTAAAGLLLLVVAAAAVWTSAGSGDQAPAPSAPRSAVPPSALVAAGDVLFGLHNDWTTDSVPAVADRLEATPAAVGLFLRLPFVPAEEALREATAAEAREAGAVLVVTLEPHDGLDAVDDAALDDLVDVLTAWNEAGLSVLVRFAHEMNGSWYPWSQQPGAYVATFQRVAAAVRASPASEIMWAPNEGAGYPFGERADADGLDPDPEDREALDTTGDGQVTQADDPYAPYWPGGEHVDWVGLSVYHFGNEPPWGENEPPPAGKFLQRVHGTYVGPLGDASAVPDFHARYVHDEGKPFAIAETGALFALEHADAGASEAEIKAAWAGQLFAPSVPDELPGLAMILWFGHVKPEAAVPDATVAWAFSHDAQVLEAVRGNFPGWLDFAEDLPTPDER
jgi:hypothetical protein